MLSAGLASSVMLIILWDLGDLVYGLFRRSDHMRGHV